MSRPRIVFAAAATVLCGCAGSPAQKPVEMLDEHTAMTVAALQEPVELRLREIQIPGTRVSVAFLGPVEWDQMGSITQGLWVQVAPAGGKDLADIHLPGQLAVILEDGVLELQPMVAPALGREPYRKVAPWGQAGYFALSVHDLKRLAASSRLALRCQTGNGSSVLFTAFEDTRPTFTKYLASRRITGD
jgi:hypothetical protein